MSQSIPLGSRIIINSFKNKNQEGIVKFCGQFPDKIGVWVGVELEEPKGDMDGTQNGEFLFECKHNYGLLLRTAQVKIVAAHPTLDTEQIDMGESPLLTPMNPSAAYTGGANSQGTSQLFQKLQQTKFQQDDGQTRASEAGKNVGWKERLENLRKKKQQEGDGKGEEKKEEISPEKKMQEEVRKDFGLGGGLTKDKDGKLQVDKEVVQKLRAAEEELQRQAEAKPQEEEKKQPAPLANKIVSGISKIGGLKGPSTGLKGPSTITSKEPQQPVVSKQPIQDAKKEQIKKQSEELKAKIDERKSEVTKVGATEKPTVSKLAGLKKPEIAKEQTEKGKQETSLMSKIGAGMKQTKAQAATEEKKLATTIQRSATVRTTAKEQADERRQETSQTKRAALGQAAVSNALRKTLAKPNQDQIKEEEDESLPTAPSTNTSVSSKQANTASERQKSPNKTKSSNISLEDPTSTNANNVQQIGFGSGANQAELKKLEGQLRKKNDEIYQLQLEVKDLSTKIDTLQEQHRTKLVEIESEYHSKIESLQHRLSDNTALAQVEQEYQEQITQLKSKLNDTSALQKLQGEAQAKEQELKAEIEQLRIQKKNAEDQANQQKIQIDEYEKEKQKLIIDIEAKNVDIEIVQTELELVKEEKEDLLNQMMMTNDVNDSDGLSALSQDELRQQNQKLRQAITTISMNFEVEKSKLDKQIQQLSERARLVEDYEQRLENMDLLLEELDVKEQERTEMEKKLEECLEYEQLVEGMYEEIQQHETNNAELKDKVRELEEIGVIAEQLNENQEQYIKELNGEIAEKEAIISNLEQEKIQIEEMALDYEDQVNKYKERFSDLKQKCKMLEEELSSAYQVGDSKVKISSLLEKQSQLITRLREANKKDLQLNNFQIEFWQEKLRTKVVEEFIPARLSEDTRLDSLEKIQLLNKAKNKATLLLREICEKQLVNIDQLYDEPDQIQNQIRILTTLSEEALKLIDSCNRIMFCIYRMPIEKYIEITLKMMAWNKFITLNTFMDNILGLIKEESLSPKFDLSIFIQSIKSVQDLQSNVELKFIDKTDYEKEQEAQNPGMKNQGELERQKLVKQSGRLNLRNECLKMALATMVLATISGFKNQDMRQKSILVYGRLLDIIIKLDSIEGKETGDQYLNLEELNLDTRLNQKYSAIQILWRGMDEGGESLDRDWSTVLESVERDITSLTNDYKYKKLIQKVDEEFQDQKLDDIYNKGWDAQGPWTLISTKIRSDLEDTNKMKEKIEQLQDKQKEQAKMYLILKKEKEEASLVNKSLEKRLAEAISKAERLPALEIEKQTWIQKEQHLQQQIEKAMKELEDLRNREKELQEKLADSEQKLESPSKASIQKRNSIAQNQNQSLKKFFGSLKHMGTKKGEQQLNLQRQTSISGAEMQKQLLLNEEIFTNIIIELQNDRMKMKGQKMLERLNKLQKSEGALNQYIIQQKEKKEMQLKLNKEDQNTLQTALVNIESLKSTVKKEMAGQRVINLLEKRETLMGIESIPELKVGSEKINYMIVKAKEEVNDAVKILFAKDSKFNQLKSFKKEQIVARESQKFFVIEEPKIQDLQRVKIGHLKLQGLIPSLADLQGDKGNQGQKTLILDADALKEMKRSLAVFAN